MAFDLRVIDETASTIEFGWDPQSVDGYRFYLDGSLVSRTFDSGRTTVRFRKGSKYEVEPVKIVPGERASYPKAAPPPPPVDLPKISGAIGYREISKPTLIEDATSGSVTFLKGSEGSIIRRSKLGSFNIFGASKITIQDTTFTGGTDNCLIWDRAGSVPTDIKIQRCSFSNFRSSDPQKHTEALYVGYSIGGIIEDCTFSNNGNTGHIFFTYFGETNDASRSYSRDWVVKGCTFGPTAGAFYSINIHEGVPVAKANLRVAKAQSTVATLVTNPAVLY